MTIASPIFVAGRTRGNVCAMSSLDGSEPAAGAQLASVRQLAGDRGRAALLMAAIAAGYAVALLVRPLVAPDEFRYAEIAREMIASGDWVVPRLDGLLYFEKPALGYWMIAASMRVFGESAAAIRLPSAVSTLLASAIVWRVVRRYGAGEAAALYAALGMLTSFEVSVIGTTAVLDAMFALGVTATLAAFFVATEHAPGSARSRWLAASGAACGAAFLVKGFLAFAIPASVAIPYLIWSRRARDVLHMGWLPLALALAIAAPWSLAIARVQPDFWHQFVVNEHLRRFAGDAQHSEPFWYFAPVVIAGALPWTSLLALAVRRRRAIASSPLLRFSVCWVVGPLALLSASAGKLMTYALPCFPALFILIADTALAQPRDRLARHLGWIAVAMAAACIAMAVALVLPLPASAVWFGATGAALRALAAVGVLAAASLAAGAARRTAPGPAAQAGAIACALALVLAVSAIGFPSGKTEKTPERWLAEHVDPVAADAIVVADRDLLHAVCWHLRRDDVRVLGGPGELRYGLGADPRARALDDRALAELIRDRSRARPLVVIGRGSELPPGFVPDRSQTDGVAFFAQYAPLAATQP
jgi:4-amino-4-deoxy-L-arabinose transferase